MSPTYDEFLYCRYLTLCATYVHLYDESTPFERYQRAVVRSPHANAVQPLVFLLWEKRDDSAVVDGYLS